MKTEIGDKITVSANLFTAIRGGSSPNLAQMASDLYDQEANSQ